MDRFARGVPTRRYVSLRGETLACLFRVPQHSGKGLAIEVALIEANATFLDDTRRDAGGGSARADGADASMALGYPVISGLILAAARKASRRLFIGVLPECAACPRKVTT